MRLVGVSCAVPSDVAAAAEACDRLGADDVGKIVKNSGVERRRVAPETVTSSDLCVAAARPLLERVGWSPQAVELVVFVSQTPDYVLPATAYCIHERLGLADTCMAFDVNLGCSGFTHGLLVVRGLMMAEGIRRALLLCGDTITKLANPMDRGTALLFGDAGSAAALDNEGPDQLRAAAWGSEGTGAGYLMVPGGGFRQPWREEFLQAEEDADGNRRRRVDLRMDGAQIFNFTIRRVPAVISQALERAKWQKEDVDYYLFHQANKFIINYLRNKLKVAPEKVPTCLEEFGNASCASIPQTMVLRLGESLAENLRLMLVGFGVGLSWSAVAMATSGCVHVPLIEV